MPDGHHLRAAQGWLELGDWQSAIAELENITPKVRAHPDVLEIRWQIYAKAQDWPACVDIAKALTKAAPDMPQSWIHHAFALHELKRTREAFDVLHGERNHQGKGNGILSPRPEERIGESTGQIQARERLGAC